MPRHYSVKSRSYRKSSPYARENTSINFTTENDSGRGGAVLVPVDSTKGKRTVRRIKLHLNSVGFTGGSFGSTAAGELFWAIVKVPEGTTANTLNTANQSSLYEPNQHVLSCGTFSYNLTDENYTVPVACKLESGDFISLIVQAEPSSGTAKQVKVSGIVSYSVKYN